MRDVLRAIAARVEPGMRVAVDGVTASGKTTFADGLAELVPGAVRVTIDDFHRPPPQEYYPDSFDFDAFVENIDFDRPWLRARPAATRRAQPPPGV